LAVDFAGDWGIRVVGLEFEARSPQRIVRSHRRQWLERVSHRRLFRA
jgi:hypothetical protein